MATEIKMPQLGESVTEGTIGKWLKQPGDHVEKYEALLEVTTDKVDTEVPAPVDGILREIAVPEGTTVRVGTLLAVLDEPGGEAASDGGRATAQNEEARASNGQDQRSTVETLERSNTFVSPVVARLVAEHSLDLSGIAGTGAGGRVTKQDVLKFVEARKTGPAPASARASGAPTCGPEVAASWIAGS